MKVSPAVLLVALMHSRNSFGFVGILIIEGLNFFISLNSRQENSEFANCALASFLKIS